MRKKVTIALAQHEFAGARHGGNDPTRFEGKDLVGIAVEEK